MAPPLTRATDSSKSWTTNSFVNKLINFRLDSDTDFHLILSNTSDSVLVDNALNFYSTGNNYGIYDTVVFNSSHVNKIYVINGSTDEYYGIIMPKVADCSNGDKIKIINKAYLKIILYFSDGGLHGIRANGSNTICNYIVLDQDDSIELFLDKSGHLQTTNMWNVINKYNSTEGNSSMRRLKYSSYGGGINMKIVNDYNIYEVNINADTIFYSFIPYGEMTFELHITYTSGIVSFQGPIYWVGGVDPVINSAGTYYFVFRNINDNWIGNLAFFKEQIPG